jgi:plastocyanin
VQGKRMLTSMVVLCAAVGLGVSTAVPAGAVAARTFTVHLDAKPHGGEPWAFLRIFPNAIQVHSGDTIRAGWAGTDTPHTATFVNTDDPESWRAQNQGPGGPYEVSIPDSQIGGDDDENIINPSVLNPDPLGCGTQGAPCEFDGSSIVNSGLLLPPLPGTPSPSFVTTVTAPVGSYSLLCLLHPGMEIPVDVVSDSQPVPSPKDVQSEAFTQTQQANHVDGVQADALAQQVTVTTHGHGHSLWTISAGGFFNNVTANEYVNTGLTVHVGDRIQVNGNFEIHTATFPADSTDTTPFIEGQCNIPGPNPPAMSPDDCADPTTFIIAFNNAAVIPTANNRLRDPTEFVNSGLLVTPAIATFVARAPGTYTMVCLVHGPEMSTTITVEP